LTTHDSSQFDSDTGLPDFSQNGPPTEGPIIKGAVVEVYELMALAAAGQRPEAIGALSDRLLRLVAVKQGDHYELTEAGQQIAAEAAVQWNRFRRRRLVAESLTGAALWMSAFTGSWLVSRWLRRALS